MRRSGAGIGYGKKSDFTKDLTASPGATRYDIKTVFERNKASSKGFSLYLSREVSCLSLRNFLIRDIFPLIHLRCQDQVNMRLLNAIAKSSTRLQFSPCARSCRSSTAQCLSNLRTRIQVLADMKIQSHFPQGEGTACPSTKGQVQLSSTLNDPFASSNSVSNILTSENVNPGPGKYEEINNLSD